MATAKPKGKGISKRVGPLPYWGWAAVGAGTFVLYRYLRARSSANAALVASGTTGGTTIPGDLAAAGGAVATGAGSFASQGAWEQAMLTYLTGNGISPTAAYAGLTSWLDGNCVSSTLYNGISAALTSSSVGLPPGFSNPPVLSVCPTSPNPPPPPPPPGKVDPYSLPHIDSRSWPQILRFGQYGAGEFTKIGVVNNGVYTGKNVTGGVPVFAGGFGGFFQGFITSKLPNGTGIYIPTQYLPYVVG
jgi:hypothetical protein